MIIGDNNVLMMNVGTDACLAILVSSNDVQSPYEVSIEWVDLSSSTFLCRQQN